MKLATKIWLLIGLTWGVGASAACFLMYRSQDISARYETLFQREVRLQESARQMQVRFKIQVQEWKNVLLRGHDPEALRKHAQAFEDEQAAVRDMAEVLRKEAPDSQIRAVTEEFLRAHSGMGSTYASALQAFTQAKGLNARDMDKLVKGQDRTPTALVDKVVDLLRGRTETERAAQQRALAWEFRALTLVLLLAFGAICTGSVVTIRAMSRTLHRTTIELRESADQVAGAAGQVSTASQSLAQGSSEQAASLEETSASSEQVNSMARRNGENSRQAAELVARSQRGFSGTTQALDQMVTAMGDINAHGGKISKIIKVIDEIAFQTNILALNAAVEAARAGDAGMGFAVVADEVRSLAQRCAQAARETASMIEESIVKSRDGKVKVDQVAEAILGIAKESATVKTLVEEVNLGSQDQARGIEQIGKALVQMEQMTQKNAASSEESASAAEELSAQSETLRDIVRRLSALVEGEQQAAEAVHAG